MNNKYTLVIGGTGKTGRRIAEKLVALGEDVRIGSRSSAIPFDWDQPATWPAALSGCHQAYVAYSPDLAVPEALDSIKELCRIAKEAGLRKLVLLSGRGEPEAQACEKVVMESGLQWTVLRCSWFNQNFSESFFLDYVKSGNFALPAGDVKEPFVDAEDIADAAVAALTEPNHDGELYELTGPENLSFKDLARILSEASGRSIRYIDTSHEDFIQSLSDAQVPESYVRLIDYLFSILMDGRNSCLTDGVQRALGREPRSFKDYAIKTAASGIWSAEPSSLQAS